MTKAGVLVCAAVLLASACNSQPAPGSTSVPATGALPPVSLPDLSRTEKSVQQQIGESDRSLQSKIASHAAPADLAAAYGDVGSLLMAAEYFDAAEGYYLRAEALAPTELRWPYYLGHIYKTRSDSAKAIAAFERVLRVRPSDIPTLVWLGNVHLDQGDPELAAPLFQQALSQQSGLVSALFGLGRAALATHDYRQAVDRFEQALAADPRATIIHYPLALAYRGLGDTANAEAHLRQRGSVEIGPPDPLIVELRGVLKSAIEEEERGTRALDGGDAKAAAAHFRAGVELAPDNPSVRQKLGTALSMLGDTQGALAQFEETVRRRPGFAQGHYSLGVLLAQGGRLPEAVEQFSTAVRLDPEFAQAKYGYALALAQTKRYEEARRQLTEGAALFPDHREFAETLARLQSIAR